MLTCTVSLAYSTEARAQKAMVCHATGSAQNPFTQIEVARAAADAHLREHVGDHEVAPGASCDGPPPPPACATASVKVLPSLVFCGAVVTTDTVLANDLHPCFGDGITIAADNVTLDLNGYLVRGVGVGTGIRMEGRSGVVVQNGRVERFALNVEITGGGGNLITKMELPGSFAYGVWLSSANNTICENTLIGNTGFHSIEVNGSGNVLLKNTMTFNNGGILLNSGNGNLAQDNTVSQNLRSGIVVGAASNTIHRNHVDGNGEAGIVLTSNVNTAIVSFNTVVGNDWDGVWVFEGANGNQILDNTTSGNGGTEAGILFYDLRDDNPACGTNVWLRNTFDFAYPECTQNQ